MMGVVEPIEKLLPLLRRREGPQREPAGRLRVDHPHPPPGHRLLGIVDESLRIDGKPAHREADRGRLVGRQSQKFVGVPVGHPQHLPAELVFREEKARPQIGGDLGRTVRNVEDADGGHDFLKGP